MRDSIVRSDDECVAFLPTIPEAQRASDLNLLQYLALRRHDLRHVQPQLASADGSIVRDLLAAGMDCMRINCAHDEPEAWERMIHHLDRAKRDLKRDCRVAMDLAGPKLEPGRSPRDRRS